MKNLVNRGFKVSEGLARLTKKKLNSFASELAQEGVLTQKEKQAFSKNMDKLGKTVDKTIMKELKKTLGATEKKQAAKKRTATKKKPASRKKK